MAGTQTIVQGSADEQADARQIVAQQIEDLRNEERARRSGGGANGSARGYWGEILLNGNGPANQNGSRPANGSKPANGSVPENGNPLANGHVPITKELVLAGMTPTGLARRLGR